MTIKREFFVDLSEFVFFEASSIVSVFELCYVTDK